MKGEMQPRNRLLEVARPPVTASAGALTLAGSPSIREISFVAIYALLALPFSAIHGDEWLFHDYNTSAGLLTLTQGCQ